MLTLEEAVKLLGKEYIPEEVFTDQRLQKEYLEILDLDLKNPRKGRAWYVKDKKVMYEAWKYLKQVA